MFKHVRTLGNKTTLNSVSTVQSASGFVQLTSTFAFFFALPLVRLEGGKRSRNKKKTFRNVWNSATYIFKLSDVAGELMSVNPRRCCNGTTRDLTLSVRKFDEKQTKISTNSQQLSRNATYSKSHRKCKSSWKVVELMGHFDACDESTLNS